MFEQNLQGSSRKAVIMEKERMRGMSNKKAQLTKCINTATKFAEVDLSDIDDKIS